MSRCVRGCMWMQRVPYVVYPHVKETRMNDGGGQAGADDHRLYDSLRPNAMEFLEAGIYPMNDGSC